ncbi:unnamed protein product [Leuciscus chuanchicus]
MYPKAVNIPDSLRPPSLSERIVSTPVECYRLLHCHTTSQRGKDEGREKHAFHPETHFISSGGEDLLTDAVIRAQRGPSHSAECDKSHQLPALGEKPRIIPHFAPGFWLPNRAGPAGRSAAHRSDQVSKSLRDTNQ